MNNTECSSLVDDVDNTVGNKDIRGGDLGTVDVDSAVLNTDSDVATTQCLQTGAIGQLRAVANSSVDD